MAYRDRFQNCVSLLSSWRNFVIPSSKKVLIRRKIQTLVVRGYRKESQACSSSPFRPMKMVGVCVPSLYR